MEGAAPKGRKESMDGCASPPDGTELIHEVRGRSSGTELDDDLTGSKLISVRTAGAGELGRVRPTPRCALFLRSAKAR